MKRKVLRMSVTDVNGAIVDNRFEISPVSPEMAFSVLPFLKVGESLVVYVEETEVQPPLNVQ